MIELIIQKAKENIPAALTTIGGIRPKRKTRTIKARCSAEAVQDLLATQGLRMEVEIAMALIAEAQAEIAYEALGVARENGELVAQLGPRPDEQFELSKEFSKEIKTLMKPMEQPVIIVSPMQLMMLYMDETFERVEMKGHGITKCGTLAGTSVVVDPYAAANGPAIVAETGWFEFDYRDLLTSKTILDEDTGDILMSFETDVIPDVKIEKVRLIKVLQG
jgi:hypothetical protein